MQGSATLHEAEANRPSEGTHVAEAGSTSAAGNHTDVTPLSQALGLPDGGANGDSKLLRKTSTGSPGDNTL